MTGGHEPKIITAYIKHMTLQGKSPETRRHYRRTLKALDHWLGNRSLLDATEDDLTNWRAGMTVSDASILAYVAAARSFYGWALAKKHLRENPSLNIPVPSLGRRLPRPIASDLLEDAIDNAPERIRPWLVLAGYAGMRCCEIATLRRENVLDGVRPRGLLVLGKRNKERLIPMSPYVWNEIRQVLPRSGWVFPRRDGQAGHTPARTVSMLGNRHLTDCGLAETMHQLRHRFGTVGYQATGDLREVQEVMGHAHLNTTAGYAAYSRPGAVQVVNAVQPERWIRPVRKQQDS